MRNQYRKNEVKKSPSFLHFGVKVGQRQNNAQSQVVEA